MIVMPVWLGREHEILGSEISPRPLFKMSSSVGYKTQFTGSMGRYGSQAFEPHTCSQQLLTLKCVSSDLPFLPKPKEHYYPRMVQLASLSNSTPTDPSESPPWCAPTVSCQEKFHLTELGRLDIQEHSNYGLQCQVGLSKEIPTLPLNLYVLKHRHNLPQYQCLYL